MTSAKESWDFLKAYHEQGTLVNTTTLMRSLWDLKLKDDQDPQIHIQKMTNTLQKLVDLGEPDLTERWKIAILLSSLPESYHVLVTALEARNQKDLTFSLIQTKVIDEHTRRNTRKESEPVDKVLKVSQDHQEKKKICFYCKKENHLMKDCFKLKRRKLKKSHSDDNARSKVNSIDETPSNSEETLFQINEI